MCENAFGILNEEILRNHKIIHSRVILRSSMIASISYQTD